jgi:hypothetical protein
MVHSHFLVFCNNFQLKLKRPFAFRVMDPHGEVYLFGHHTGFTIFASRLEFTSSLHVEMLMSLRHGFVHCHFAAQAQVLRSRVLQWSC